MKYTTIVREPCLCGYNRWKTKCKLNPVSMHSIYQCRNCGSYRKVSAKQYYELVYGDKG